METNNGPETPENKQPSPPPQQAVSEAEANVVPVVTQQPWVAMQYPAAAMVMQHPPHYIPYHPHHHHHPPQQQQQNKGGGSNNENRTIWVGDLHNWMDEDYLRTCFASTNEDCTYGNAFVQK